MRLALDDKRFNMNDRIPSLNLNERPSKYFKDDLEFFLKTDVSILKDIFCNVDLHWATDKEEEIKRLSKKLSVVEGDISTILAIGTFIFSKLKKGELTFDALNEDFKKLGFDKAAYTKMKEAYETYGMEFAEKNNLRTTYRERFYEGANMLKSLISKINYRVITDENKKVLDLVPVIEININVIPFEGSKDKQEQITFHATEKDFNKMKEALDNVRTEFIIASEYLKGLKSKK